VNRSANWSWVTRRNHRTYACTLSHIIWQSISKC